MDNTTILMTSTCGCCLYYISNDKYMCTWDSTITCAYGWTKLNGQLDQVHISRQY